MRSLLLFIATATLLYIGYVTWSQHQREAEAIAVINARPLPDFESGDEAVVVQQATVNFYDKPDHQAQEGTKIIVYTYDKNKRTVYFLSTDPAGNRVAMNIRADALQINKKAAAIADERNQEKQKSVVNSSQKSLLTLQLMNLHQQAKDFQTQVTNAYSKVNGQHDFRTEAVLESKADSMQRNLDAINAQIVTVQAQLDKM